MAITVVFILFTLISALLQSISFLGEGIKYFLCRNLDRYKIFVMGVNSLCVYGA